jgi:DNA-binding HxlR family transcriptional regulator
MKDSAELFEAISHPERIKILKILEKKPSSFASLKRQLGIESSGNLDFHLKKLGKLVTVQEDGLYGLTEAGKEALLSIDEVDSWMETRRHKVKIAHFIGGALCISSGLLAVILEILQPGDANFVFSILCCLLVIGGGVLILLRINILGGVISIIFNFFPLPPLPHNIVPSSETANHIYNLILKSNPSFSTCGLIAGIVGSLPVIGAFLALFVGRKLKG